MIRRDPIFKGCTRPAMVWGVPIVPFVLVFGLVTLTAVWSSLFLFIAFVPLYTLMRLIVRSDDQQFRLLGLKAKCRLLHRNRNGRFWKASTYGPVAFVKRTSP